MACRIIYLSLYLITLLAVAASAVMPPAPQEWYEKKLGKAITVDFDRKLTVPDRIRQDLAAAAKARSKNSDNLLIILVEFYDNLADKVSHTPAVYDNLLFSNGGVPTGSMVEYYEEISYGSFTPTGTVTAWIVAPYAYTYYTNGQYGTGGYPYNSQSLLEHCVDILDPMIDFSQFDNNYDGFAEGIFLIHAGPPAEETRDPDDIWSHAWVNYYDTDDGVSTGRYSVEPEMHMDGSLIDIGVFCHEYGHVLGLPDLYDTDYSSEGIGVYCLMAGGSWGGLPGTPERPTHMSAEMKLVLGWLSPIAVSGNLEDIYIPPVETDPVCYQITNPSRSYEYFLIENRAKVGFDSLFRGDGGIAVWHVDEFGDQNNEFHRYVSLEQADGNGDLERVHGDGNRHPRTNRGDAGDLYPGATGNMKFSFASDPDSKSYYGGADLGTVTFYERNDSIFVNIYTDPLEIIFSITDINVIDTVLSLAESDQDGDADYGEVVDLVLTLACEGSDAPVFQGEITIADPRVNIITGSASFDPVSHRYYTDNQASPFRFEVLSANNDSAVTFNLTLDDGSSTQDLEFKVNINQQKLLLVLDNNGSHWSDNLISALHECGYSFDVYSTAEQGTPTLGLLDNYIAVLWTTGSYFGKSVEVGVEDYEYCLTSSEISVLQSYLDNNGRLGLFSQDYIYDRGMESFALDYLHVSSVTEDEGSSEVYGEPGSLFEGFSGTHSEWSFYDYTDYVTPDVDARIILNDNSKAGPVAITYPLARPTSDDYAATFSGFAIERLDRTSLVDFVSRWADLMISFCGDANGDGNVNIGDAVYLVNVVFHYGELPSPYANGDVNCDGNINVGDAVFMTNFIFVEEAPIPCAACQ
jgi:M6 family metalloprotease-like protein